MLDKSRLSQPVSKKDNLSPDEVRKFDEMADQWWDPHGKFKTALAFNAARLDWILPRIARHFNRQLVGGKGLNGLSVLDVGSGGGLISEAIAMRGARVTGIDASAVSVQVATRHAQGKALDLTYEHALSAELVQQEKTFDVVINAEVVEHVPDQAALIKDCCDLVTPGGLALFATLNRTLKSYIVAIVGAEYVMQYLPIGTHDWRYFVTPHELNEMARCNGVTLTESTGMKMNPFTQRWRYSKDMSVNYIQLYEKRLP